MKYYKNLSEKDRYVLCSGVSSVYKSIFKLDTPLLLNHYTQVYKELISRDDYNSLDDLKLSYQIIKDELIKRGVSNV